MRTVFIGGSKGGAPRMPPGCKFFHFHAAFGKKCAKQECIPVGCVLSAARCSGSRGGAVCLWGCFYLGCVCLPRRGCLSRGWCVCVCPRGGLPHTSHAQCMLGYLPPGPVHAGINPSPPWTEFLTHACENITFPQLRCGRK